MTNLEFFEGETTASTYFGLVTSGLAVNHGAKETSQGARSDGGGLSLACESAHLLLGSLVEVYARPDTMGDNAVVASPYLVVMLVGEDVIVLHILQKKRLKEV